MKSVKSMKTYPALGFGLGLRATHYQAILDMQPEIDFFEIISENYMVPGGKPLYFLEKIRAHYPLVMHGVSLSIGSMDPLDQNYLKKLKTLADDFDVAWISDHLCWTGIHRINSHDLLPLPYTEEALAHVVTRIKQVQDYLGRRISIENPSSYVAFKVSSMSEWEFMARLAEEADCLILLDINNVYVSAFNHGFDAKRYINHMPASRVQQFHLAGHTNKGKHIIDTHDHAVIDAVWDLYQYTVARFPSTSTLLERDDNIPPLNELLLELSKARTMHAKSLQRECYE